MLQKAQSSHINGGIGFNFEITMILVKLDQYIHGDITRE